MPVLPEGRAALKKGKNVYGGLSVGIVCLAGKDNPATEVLPEWKKLIQDDTFDFVFVETGTEKEIAEENRKTCLDYGVKRVWVPLNGAETRCDGRNAGAQIVNGEYLWFVDGDCCPDLLATTVEQFKAQMRMVAFPNTVTSGHIFFEQQDINADRLPDHRIPYMSEFITITQNASLIAEANVLIPRELFNSAGRWNASWAINGYCAEGVHLYWRCLTRFCSPLVLTRGIGVTHHWHPPSPEREKIEENRDALLMELSKLTTVYASSYFLGQYEKMQRGLFR